MILPIRYHSAIEWLILIGFVCAVAGCADRTATNRKLKEQSFYGHVEIAWKYVKMDCGLKPSSTLSDLRSVLADLNQDEPVDFSILAPDELLLAVIVGVRLGGDLKQLTLSKTRKGVSRMRLIEYSKEIQREFVRDPDGDGFPSFFLYDRTGKITLTSDLGLSVE